ILGPEAHPIAGTSIDATFDAAGGALNLTGPSTLLEYQAALRSITYRNTLTTTPSNRQFTFTVTDVDSNAGSAVVNVTFGQHVSPTLSSTGGATGAIYTRNQAPAIVDGSPFTITGTATMTKALVTITTGTGAFVSGQDKLTVVGSLGG